MTDKREGPFWDPKKKVLENINKAELFIKKGQGSDIPLTWCVEIAAGGLWSAIDILIKKVPEARGKVAGSTTAWFKENGDLVSQIRLAAEHYEQPVGIGETIGGREGEGDTVRTFLWVVEEGEADPRKLPIEQVLDGLLEIAERVKQTVIRTTGEVGIPFVP